MGRWPVSADVVSLADRRLAPVPEVVAMFADLLRRAESGEIRGAVVGAACDAHCEATTYELGDGTIAALYLAIERARLRLLEIR